MISPLLKREIENTFSVIATRSNDNELVFLCPECGDVSGNRSVNLKTGKTFCWRCNKGKSNKGYFIAWARSLGFAFASDIGYSGVPVADLLYQQESKASEVPLLETVELPTGFTPIARKPGSFYTKLVVEMAARKNLTKADFYEAGVGYTMDDPLWEPFALFPVYEYDTCVYYQGRTYIDVPGETTKRFPSRNVVRWGAGYWVYNIDALRRGTPDIVVIVESILNVLSLRKKFRALGWTNIIPVCVFKHHLSRVQTIKLLRCKGVREFCMLFDHDAIDVTWKNVNHLSDKVPVTVAEMPATADNKKLDPNDDVDAAIVAIEKRKLYTAGSASGQLLAARKGLLGKEIDITRRSFSSFKP